MELLTLRERGWLQSAMDSYYKLRKQSATEFTTIYDDRYYKVRWFLQIATVHIGYLIL